MSSEHNNGTIKNILRLVWPAFLTQVLISGCGMIDLVFAGKISTQAIATISISNAVITPLFYFLEGIRTGTTVLTANYFGAQEKNNIAKILRLSLFFAILIGLTLVILSPFISKYIYIIFACPDIPKELVERFSLITLISIPFTLVVYAIIGFFRGLQNTLIPLIITTIICSINASFDFLLVTGNFGVPQMGIIGISLSTLISYSTGAFIALLFLIKHKLTKEYVFVKIKIRKLAREYLRLAAEIGFYTGMQTIAITFFIFIIKNLGSKTIAAYEITQQIYLLSFLPVYGFQPATSILIAKYLGSEQKKLIIPTTKKIIFLCLFSVITLNLILTPIILKFFSTSDPFILNLIKITTRIALIEQFFSIIGLLTKEALAGLKDTKFIDVTTILTGYVFFMPLVYFVSVNLNFGLMGRYSTFAFWAALDSIIFSWRLFIDKKWLKYHV
ncbi:MATE family efflux transporter [Candidatus Babeliales bacterium]|nr:MATE family efflux transporter [Candidatus Babeliales bacterium]